MNFTDLRNHWAESAAIEPKFGTGEEIQLLERCRPIADELRKLGWQEAIYCPKDGSNFIGWEFPWGKPGLCCYQGEWPKGFFWLMEAGDMWPVRLNLWRPITPDEQRLINEFKNCRACST